MILGRRPVRWWLVLLPVLSCARTSVDAQPPDLEVCQDPLQLTVGVVVAGSASGASHEYTIEIDVDSDVVIADLQVGVHWRIIQETSSSENFNVWLTSPAGTTVRLGNQVVLGKPKIKTGKLGDFAFSDHGQSFHLTTAWCRCLRTPREPLAGFAGESALGAWTLLVVVPGGNTVGSFDRICLRFFETRRALAVKGLACTPSGAAVDVEWVNAEDYDAIDVRINDEFVESLAGPFVAGVRETYTTPELPSPQYARVTLVPFGASGDDGHALACEAAIQAEPALELCDAPAAEFSFAEAGMTTTTVDRDLAVVDLAVAIDIDSNNLTPAHVDLTLESPSGTVVALMNKCRYEFGSDVIYDTGPCRNWGWANVLLRRDVVTTFWDLGRRNQPFYDAAEHIRPAGPGALSDFAGETAAGDWILQARVDSIMPSSVVAVIESWCLRFGDEPPPLAVSGLTCTPGAESGDYDLTWTNAADYDEIRIYVDDELAAALDGPFAAGEMGSWSYTIPPYPSFATFDIHGLLGGAPGPKSWCVVYTSALEDLECTGRDDGSGILDLEWQRFIEFDEIRIYVGEKLEATLAGTADSHATAEHAVPQNLAVRVAGVRDGAEIVTLGCTEAVLDTARLELCDEPDALIDSASGVTSRTVEAREAFPVGEVEVALDFESNGAWGLKARLVSPQGTVVSLYFALLGDASLDRLVVSDRGAPPGAGLPAACRCIEAPAGPGDLADLIGEPSAGMWTLELENHWAYPVPVTLEAWCLRLHEGCATAGPEDLSCDEDGIDVVLSWLNPGSYDEIEVLGDDKLLARLAGSEGSYRHEAAPNGALSYRVAGSVAGCRSLSASCRLERGFSETCQADLDLAVGEASLDVVLEGAGVVQSVELGVVVTNETPGVDYEIEVTSPGGTSVVLFDDEVHNLHNFDVTFTDEGLPYDDALVSAGLRLQPPWPNSLAALAGENLSIDPWTVRVAVASTTATLEALCLRAYEERCTLAPPGAPACSTRGDGITLAWENEGSPSAIELEMNGQVVALLPGTAESHELTDLQPGPYQFEVRGLGTAGCTSTRVGCEVELGLLETCAEPNTVVGGDASVTELLEVVNLGGIEELEISVDLPGIDAGGWELHVTSPGGTELVLHDGRGSGPLTATFSDRGEANTGFLAPDFGCECRVRPQGAGTLADFQGENASGEWTLAAANGTDAAGVFVGWCVRVYERCDGLPPDPVTCTASGDDVELAWGNGDRYEEVVVYRGESPVAMLAGDATEFLDSGVGPGYFEYRIGGRLDGCVVPSGRCGVEVGGLLRCGELGGSDDQLWHSQSVEFLSSVRMTSVEVILEASGVGAGHELEIESPWGTRVVLSRVEEEHNAVAETYSVSVVFSDRGRPYEPAYLGSGDVLAPMGPGRLSDLNGELSAGPQPWTLRYHSVPEPSEWCVRIFPAMGEVVETPFRRGDVDGDGILSPLLDALYLLVHGFLGGAEPPCARAADADDSGGVAPLLDALYVLSWWFTGGPAPPAPGDRCGVDETADALSCVVPPDCD